MTEIKQTVESPQAVPMERPTETAEPAHVERVTKKKDPKKVAAGVQALPPGKSVCLNSFRHPRNYYVCLALTTRARLLLRRKRSAQTNGHSLTGSHGLLGLVLWGVHLRMSLWAKTWACAPVLRRWRQAPRPKSNIPN